MASLPNRDRRRRCVAEGAIDKLALVFCAIVLVVCLAISYFRQVGNFGVETDFYGVYAIETANILAGKPYTYQHNPPGYCLLLAVISYLTGDAFLAGKLISAFATVIFCGINYLLLKFLVEAKFSLIITIITFLAIIPSPLLASTDILGATFIVLSIWLFLCEKLSLKSRYFLSGFSAGIAYLIRTHAIFAIVGIVIGLILFNPARQIFKQRLLGVSLAIAGFISIVSPWFIYNWQTNGSLFASTSYAQIAAHFYHPQGDELITSVNQMKSRFHSLSEVILYQPDKLLRQYFSNIFFVNIPKLIVSDVVFKNVDFPIYQILILPPLILFFLSFSVMTKALLQAKREDLLKHRQVRVFFLMNFLGYLLLGLVGFTRRYYLFFFPCLLAIIIYPLYYHRFWKQEIVAKIGFLKLSIRSLLITSIALLFAIAATLQIYILLTSEPRYLLEIADFLKARSTPDRVIIVRKPHLAYLSGLKQAFPLANTPEEYAIEIKNIGANYIVYSDYEAKLWTGLQFLANPQSVPENFQLIYRHQPSNTLVYEIKQD